MTSHNRQPVPRLFVNRHKREIQDLREYHLCAAAMRSDSTIARHIDNVVGVKGWYPSPRVRTAWDYLSYLVSKQFERSGKGEFDPAVFDHAYGDIEQFIYSADIALYALSALPFFESNVTRIDLGGGLLLRKLTQSEVENAFRDYRRVFDVYDSYIDVLKYGLELTYKATKVLGTMESGFTPEREPDPRRTFTDVLTALRLFKSGTIGFDIIRVSMTSSFIPPVLQRSAGSRCTQFRTKAYSLTQEEANEFLQFWKESGQSHLTGVPELKIALRRFNSACEGDGLEERLLDYAVAFEALLSKEEERGEITHRLSTRTARLLAQSYNERVEIAKRMKDFYNERSSLLHRGTTTFDSSDDSIIEEYLRRSIREFGERLRTERHDSIISRLDLG